MKRYQCTNWINPEEVTVGGIFTEELIALSWDDKLESGKAVMEWEFTDDDCIDYEWIEIVDCVTARTYRYEIIK